MKIPKRREEHDKQSTAGRPQRLCTVGPDGPYLRGFVNDVRDVAQTLNALGLVPPSPRFMRILTDVRATRSNILGGVTWLLPGAAKNDRLILYYSGHGSQMLDLTGEEGDRKDETLCPHDYATAGMIKDDDLRSILGGLPAGVNLDVIFDSCHAGTATRVLAALEAAPEEQLVAYCYIEPLLDYGYFLDANPTAQVTHILRPESTTTRELVLVPGLRHVLWAACRDYQASAEAPIGGVWRGVFTYCFCRALHRAGPGITRRRLDGLVSADVRALGHSQVPQLEVSGGSVDESVFT